ncbi:phage baseplate assembly protein V [Photobacterium swingsii]|uniref:phage baseplate assembly protein V n=1 Tax=Photobacterium swingsii TaxID=680026 RepID=UPI00352CB50F
MLMPLQLIRRIESLERELLRLSEEAEENRRCSSNVIRLGVVAEAYKTTVDVKAGPNKATAVPFFVFCAGRVSHYRRPSVGEQCLLLNLGSGDNLNNSVALMGLPSTQYPVPTTAENEFMTDYGGGMTEVYNLDEGSLTATYPGGLFIIGDTQQKGNYKATGDVADGVRTMAKDRVIYNGHVHNHGVPKTSKTEQQQ